MSQDPWRRGLFGRLRIGLIAGMVVATIFAALASSISSVAGDPATSDHGIPLGQLVRGYYIGGTVAGLVWGALAPIAKWRLGAGLLGFLMLLPVGLGGIALMPEHRLGDGGWIAAVIWALLMGGLGGLHFFEPDKVRNEKRR